MTMANNLLVYPRITGILEFIVLQSHGNWSPSRSAPVVKSILLAMRG